MVSLYDNYSIGYQKLNIGGKNMETVNLFKKTFKNGGYDKDTYFVKLAKTGVCVTAYLSSSFKNKMLGDDVDFPVTVELDVNKNDYFIKDEEYENKEGITLSKKVIVLQGYRGISHLELERVTLSDLDVEKSE